MAALTDLESFAQRWAEVSPLLEAIRDRELLETPLPVAMDQLASMVDSAVFLKPLQPWSGLVEMQLLLARMR